MSNPSSIHLLSSHPSCDVYQAKRSGTNKPSKDHTDLTVWSDGDEFLNKFIFPLSSSIFLQRYYRHKSVAFLNGGNGRIQSLITDYLCDGDIEQLLEESPSENISIWLKKKETSTVTQSSTSTSSRLIQSIRVTEPQEALIGYEAGGSLYFRAPSRVSDKFIPALSESLSMGSIGSYYDPHQKEPRGETETFISRAGHTTDWHWDFMENFTFQITGRKRWLLKMGNIHSPLRGATPHYRVNNDVVEQQVKTARLVDPDFQFNPPKEYFENDVTEVILGPGDLFYFPAGCWHRVECLEDGISINLSVVGTTWADMGSTAIRTLLWRDDTWRQIISMDPSVVRTTASLPLHNNPTKTNGRSTAQTKKRSRSTTEDDNTGTTLSLSSSLSSASVSTANLFPGLGKLPDIYSHTERMLKTLKQQVNLLRPEHILPPSVLLSYRYDGLPGSSSNRSNNDDDDDDDDEEEIQEEKKELSNQTVQVSGEDGHVAGPGVRVRYHNHQLTLRITDHWPEEKEISFEAYHQHNLSLNKVFELNPLAVISRSRDLVDIRNSSESSFSSSTSSNIVTYTVNLNFGTEELHSMVRSVIEIEHILVPVMDYICKLSSGPIGTASLNTPTKLQSLTLGDLHKLFISSNNDHISSSSSMIKPNRKKEKDENLGLRLLQSLLRGLVFVGGGSFI